MTCNPPLRSQRQRGSTLSTFRGHLPPPTARPAPSSLHATTACMRIAPSVSTPSLKTPMRWFALRGPKVPAECARCADEAPPPAWPLHLPHARSASHPPSTNAARPPPLHRHVSPKGARTSGSTSRPRHQVAPLPRLRRPPHHRRRPLLPIQSRTRGLAATPFHGRHPPGGESLTCVTSLRTSAARRAAPTSTRPAAYALTASCATGPTSTTPIRVRVPAGVYLLSSRSATSATRASSRPSARLSMRRCSRWARRRRLRRAPLRHRRPRARRHLPRPRHRRLGRRRCRPPLLDSCSTRAALARRPRR